MIKGINKQIIEIRCTNDEYFDKVLLFVRADRTGTPGEILRRSADNCCGRILPAYRMKRISRSRVALRILTLILSLALLAIVLLLLITL